MDNSEDRRHEEHRHEEHRRGQKQRFTRPTPGSIYMYIFWSLSEIVHSLVYTTYSAARD